MMCEFCKEHRIEKVFTVDEIDGTVEMFTRWDYGMFRIGATDGAVTAYYQPKYCPECGRKLKGEEDEENIHSIGLRQWSDGKFPSEE